ncbi:hypothetical protein C8Q75DRAFT_806636 [Abortiporus biennis]|nr:hypothetical protein C8Q75DRAFT_806636 [Abortiporus biennis]
MSTADENDSIYHPTKTCRFNPLPINSSPNSISKCNILNLPTEILESIILQFTHFPQDITSFASTCKSIYSIIYKSSDNHLWRSLFLSQYDDPRSCPTILLSRLRRNPQDETMLYDWGLQLKRRTWALKWWTRASLSNLPNKQIDQDGFLRIHNADSIWNDGVNVMVESSELRARAMDILFDIILTSKSIGPPPTPDLELVDGSSLSQKNTNSIASFVQSSRTTSKFPPLTSPNSSRGDHRESINCNLIERLNYSYMPKPYADHLCGSDVLMKNGHFDESREGRALHRFLSHSFCINRLIQRHSSKIEEDSRDENAINTAENSSDIWDANDEHYMTKRFRVAYRKVYNMQYAKLRRLKGPFLDFLSLPSPPKLRNLCLINPDAHFPCGLPSEEHKSWDWRRRIQIDWSYIQSARRVLELAFLQYVDASNIVEQERTLLGLQADGDHIQDFVTKIGTSRWGMWGAGLVDASLRKRLKSTFDGWDWAGVEGIWRRFNTWVDIEELIAYNKSGLKIPPALTSQVCDLVPVRLRISSYDWYSNSPYKLPGIIFVGEIGAEFWDPESSDPEQHKIEHIIGRVDMLENEEVVWSMWSHEDQNHFFLKWVTQGVQIGGIGSRAGIIGMWTAFGERDLEGVRNEARHDPGDEALGVWWQWKVQEGC